MAIYQLGEHVPDIAATAYITDSATVVGRVTIKANSSVWFQVTVRGDNEDITIGENCNLQEGAVLHADPGFPLTLGDNVSVGHQAMIHGCTIGEGSLIGIQAVILNGAKIGKNCLVGAGALVTEGKEYPDNSLILGTPAKVVRSLSETDIANLRRIADSYVTRSREFKNTLKKIG
jgi:carbonic anhydrase/acetyltransferase-like protein (isoleucine patch superfamily)